MGREGFSPTTFGFDPDALVVELPALENLSDKFCLGIAHGIRTRSSLFFGQCVRHTPISHVAGKCNL